MTPALLALALAFGAALLLLALIRAGARARDPRDHHE